MTAATNDRAAPFPAPPGLENVAAGAEAEAAATPLSPQEVLKRAVIQDVEAKVSERVDELWQKGKHMLTQVQQKQQDKSEKLAQEVSQCLERQRALEEENRKLKQVLEVLAQRLALISPGLQVQGSTTPKPGSSTSPATTSAGTASVASSTPSQLHASDVYPSGEAGYPPLPEVPAFPFPAMQTPLCLSEALGHSASTATTPMAQPPTPLSLANSLPPTPSVPEVPYAPNMVFTMTLRKADQTELGLNVSPIENNKVLYIEGIRPEGAVDAWNRQCAGSAQPEKSIIPGDKIVSVNSVHYNADKMLEECKDRQLLKLIIVRGEGPLPELTPTASVSSPSKLTGLRADANEFVPMSSPQVSEA
eukprot:CAMPEP_0197650734 /NCGR_PEP_ID=MMETSP1338-20131121/31123_1 /TAXON_ID=43686 ORGANISM="Pelagodinium beii, Strain RCC1491" /NCGR_SAMPLE_ID=MMETSP1338 /ASSEMBLY_ACC=CAM_ASM_000754 /LENGTH=361 /DNA_ID=CAMNT_0043225201 /DNA_START=93 /DNA_END=1178 /DNA_ORIENTATION=-